MLLPMPLLGEAQGTTQLVFPPPGFSFPGAATYSPSYLREDAKGHVGAGLGLRQVTKVQFTLVQAERRQVLNVTEEGWL
jgi:hypothetical protein